MYELVFGSQQPKAKEFRKHCCNVMFPHVRQQLTNKLKEDYQQAIEEKDNQIQALEDTNEENQQKILRVNEEINDIIANRHIARRGCFFFLSIWVFFHEHSRFTVQQGKGESIYLTPHYHFHRLHRHLDISRTITVESSPLFT